MVPDVSWMLWECKHWLRTNPSTGEQWLAGHMEYAEKMNVKFFRPRTPWAGHRCREVHMKDESDARHPGRKSSQRGKEAVDAIHIPPTVHVRPAGEIIHPFSLAELREGYRLAGLEGDDVEAYFTELSKLWGPNMDVAWSEDTLLLVAMVSDSARERARKHAGWTAEELESRLAKRRRRA